MTSPVVVGFFAVLLTASLSAASSPASPLPLNSNCGATGSVCDTGLLCAGPPERRLCKYEMTEGKQCDVDPYWVCAPGLNCVNNICRAPRTPLGGSCSASGTICDDNLVCGGPEDARVCVKSLPVGERCEHEPFWLCKKELACENNVCKIPKDGRCTGPNPICVDGTVCVGNERYKKCVVPMGEGKGCGSDPFWICESGLECVNLFCKKPKIPLGGSCAAEGSVCEDKLQCGGPKDARVCVKSLPVGDRCEHEPFWLCKTSLECEKNVCKIPEDGNCAVDRAICVDGTICAGSGSNKKCVRPIDEGTGCDASSPLSICKEGLKCDDSKCRKPKIPLGGSCEKSGSVCEDKLQCAGPADAKVCVKTMLAGGRCNHEPFWVCASGLQCVKNVCRIPAGGDCKVAKDACIDGSICVGVASAKKCVIPGSEGEACTNDPFSICKAGLICFEGTCRPPKIPIGGNCAADGVVCEDGLQCYGSGSTKTCVKKVPVGGRCQHKPHYTCEKDLSCERNVCKIPVKGSCNSSGSFCVDGTVCVGPAGRRQCRVPMPVGKKCMTDPYWVCKVGLKCERRICKIPTGGNCSLHASECVSGSICAGIRTRKICIAPIPEGKRCNKSPYSVCAGKLSCIENVCKKPRVPLHGNCTPRGSVCESGAVCVGPASRKRCKTPMPVGKKCNTDPYWVCEAGLTCQRNICKIPMRGDCTKKGSVCVSRTECAGPPNRKRCMPPVREGRRCGFSQYYVCSSELRCILGVCRKPTIPVNGNCTPRGSKCVSGAVCIGPILRKRCRMPMPVGKKCNTDPYWVCKTGLTCEGNICKIPVRGNCTPRGSLCVSRAVCAGPASRKRCVMPMTEGKKCNTDPYWVCATGLRCVRNVCRKPKVPVGGNCTPRGSVCTDGSVCAGPSRARRCVRPRRPGYFCRIGSHYVCGGAYKCIGHRCRRLVGLHARCSSSFVACGYGTVCAGPRHARKCVNPMGMGQKCGTDPYWVCRSGLSCVRYRCVKAIRRW